MKSFKRRKYWSMGCPTILSLFLLPHLFLVKNSFPKGGKDNEVSVCVSFIHTCLM